MFLFYTFFLLLFLVLLVLSMTFKIKIKNLKYQSEPPHICKDYKIFFYVCVLNKIPIFRLSFTKEKIEKINQEFQIKEKIIPEIEKEKSIQKDLKEILENIKLETEKLDLEVELGTENVILTSFLIPAVSTILTILLQKTKCKPNKQKFKVQPVYKSKNLVNFQLEGIFKVKMIHIISTICILRKKRRVEEHERTSNRGAYDYGYE